MKLAGKFEAGFTGALGYGSLTGCKPDQICAETPPLATAFSSQPRHRARRFGITFTPPDSGIV